MFLFGFLNICTIITFKRTWEWLQLIYLTFTFTCVQDIDIAKGPKEDFILQFYRVGPLSFLKTYHKKEKDISFEEFKDVWFRDVKPQSLQQGLHNLQVSLAFKAKIVARELSLTFLHSSSQVLESLWEKTSRDLATFYKTTLQKCFVPIATS